MYVFCIFVLAPVQRNWACFTWKGVPEIRSLLLLLLLLMVTSGPLWRMPFPAFRQFHMETVWATHTTQTGSIIEAHTFSLLVDLCVCVCVRACVRTCVCACVRLQAPLAWEREKERFQTKVMASRNTFPRRWLTRKQSTPLFRFACRKYAILFQRN